LLMKHLVLDGEDVKGLVEKDGARAINTDVNMRLEFDAPRRLYQPPPAVPVMREILASARPTPFAEAFERWGGTKEQARAFHLAATIFASQNLLELARQLAAAGLRIDPEQPQLLADRLTLSPREADIDTLERSLPAILALDEARASKVGGGLLEMGRSDLGNAVFKRLVALHPGSVSAWTKLAISSRGRGQGEEARRPSPGARALTPSDEPAQKSSAASKAETNAKRGEQASPSS